MCCLKGPWTGPVHTRGDRGSEGLGNLPKATEFFNKLEPGSLKCALSSPTVLDMFPETYNLWKLFTFVDFFLIKKLNLSTFLIIGVCSFYLSSLLIVLFWFCDLHCSVSIFHWLDPVLLWQQLPFLQWFFWGRGGDKVGDMLSGSPLFQMWATLHSTLLLVPHKCVCWWCILVKK